jgi:hypothetical protein
MYIDGKEVKKIQAEEGTIVRANDSQTPGIVASFCETLKLISFVDDLLPVPPQSIKSRLQEVLSQRRLAGPL